MNIFSQVFRKNARIAVVREGERFFLKCYMDGELAPFSRLCAQWPELSDLSRFVPNRAQAAALLRLPDVPTLCGTLGRLQSLPSGLRRLDIYIDRDVLATQLCSQPPAGFEVRYARVPGGLRRSLTPGAVELEDGWTRLENVYWRLNALTDAQLALLREDFVGDARTPELLSSLSAFRWANLRVLCPLRYEESPAVTVRLLGYRPEGVSLQPVWQVPPSEVDETFRANGLVLAANVVRPGIAPSTLARALGHADAACELTGAAAARFCNETYPELKPFMSGDLEGFERMHCRAGQDVRWVLVARPRVTRGIGRAYAHPCARIGGALFTPEEVRALAESPCTRVEGGWIDDGVLARLGVDATGQLPELKALKSVRLTPEALLYRGSARLDDLFSELILDGAPWLTEGTRQAVAEAHLRFLTGWGLSGGLTGGYEAMIAYGVPLLRRYRDEAPEGTVCVLALPEDRPPLEEALRTLPESQDPPRLLTYEEAAGQGGALRADLLLMVEPERGLSRLSNLAQRAFGEVRAECRVGFFLNLPNRFDGSTPFAAMALGCRSRLELLDWLVRDPRAARPLPMPYAFPGRIPRRAPSRAMGAAAPSIHTSEQVLAFFADARKHANLTVDSAPPAPYQSAMPRYAELSAEQWRWYLCLRGQLRRGVFPDADEAYLRLYLTEILNGIGVIDARAGYDAMLALWRGYGTRHCVPKALAAWSYDYLRCRPCGVSPEDLLWDAPALPDLPLNVILTEISDAGAPLVLPLWALERLSGHGVRAGRFYQSEDPELAGRVFSGAVAAVDQALRAESGKGLLDAWGELRMREEEVYPFRGLLVEARTRYTARFRAYAGSTRLEATLKPLLRHIENLYRAKRKYAPRLQVSGLDPRCAAWAERAVGDAFAESAPKAPRITLDLSQLEKLRAESDQVRDALIASAAASAPGAALPREKLTEAQRALVDHLRAAGGAMAPEALRAALPGQLLEAEADAVNAAALEALGQALILREGDLWRLNAQVLDALSSWGAPEAARPVEAPDPAPSKSPAPKPAGPSAPARSASGPVPASPSLSTAPDGEWRALLEGASAAHLTEALRQLLNGPEAFRAWAKARGQMPETLLDAVNDLAMDALGDLLAGEDGVYEDYREILNHHLSEA